MSLFCIPEVRALAERQGVQATDFDQRQYGAKSTKPIRILYSGIDLSDLSARRNRPRTWIAFRDRQRRVVQ
eukprot:11432751-Alexandrium_andersonii.AAC.1